MDYGTCRVCGQSNPLSRRFCALCGRESWAGDRSAPAARGGQAAQAGVSGLMDSLDARVEQRRELRATDQASATEQARLDRSA